MQGRAHNGVHRVAACLRFMVRRHDVINGVWTAVLLWISYGRISLYQPLKNFSQTNSLIQLAYAGTERIFEILDEKPSITDQPGAGL